jgi:FRG domain
MANGGVPVPILQAPDWAAFQRIVDHIDIDSPLRPTYIFRGQAEDWPLVPSLARTARLYNWTASQALTVESVASKEFLRVAHYHLPPLLVSPQLQGRGWTWTLMQHYGAPTRLLDWTKSPYVAAYFACGSSFDKDGIIWVVQARSVRETMIRDHGSARGHYDQVARQESELFVNPEAPALIYFLDNALLTDRMRAQQTMQSISTQILQDHGHVISEALAGDRQRITKLVIPADEKPKFLRKLRRMNMTAEALFPGSDGLGRSIRELVTMSGFFDSIEVTGGS